LKIIISDNAVFHSTKDVDLSNNIILLPFPLYSPELNPTERVCQEIKSKISMKIYDTVVHLENMVIEIINSFSNKDISSLQTTLLLKILITIYLMSKSIKGRL